MTAPTGIIQIEGDITPEQAERFAKTWRGPRNIVEAIARVIDELPGIGKDQQASQAQGGYAYRGIEAITKSAAPLFAKYGVVFVPQVLSHEIREITVNNKPWTDTILTVRYRICGPGGADDFLEATVVGIGRDNADKGANKALTQAFKYALIQTLCIADAKDDNDGIHAERDSLPTPEPMASKADVDAFNKRVFDELNDEQRSEFVHWKADQGFPWPWPQAALEAMEAKLEEIVGAEDQPAPPERSDPRSDASNVGEGDGRKEAQASEAIPGSGSPAAPEPVPSPTDVPDAPIDYLTQEVDA